MLTRRPANCLCYSAATSFRVLRSKIGFVDWLNGSYSDSGPTTVGRIMKVHAAPVGTRWMWTLAFDHHEDRTPTHGYEPTRDAAMAAFAKGVVLRSGSPLSGAIRTLSRHRSNDRL